ncbi:hypothetical protein HDU99_004218 [Rhizoclosmatium hyalinum]|nr:hypothetical protein HDU99_004218 [Rhizoclosmatium hyalinum]
MQPLHTRTDSGVSHIGTTVTLKVRPRGEELDECEITVSPLTMSALKHEIQDTYELTEDFTLSVGLKKDGFRMNPLSMKPDGKLKRIVDKVDDPVTELLFEFVAKYQFKVLSGETYVVVTVGKLALSNLKQEIQSAFSELTEFHLQYLADGIQVKLNEDDAVVGDSDLGSYYHSEIEKGTKVPLIFVIVPGSPTSSAPNVDVAERTLEVLSAPSKELDTLTESHYDTMVSYSWETQSQVIKLKESLEAALGIKIWMDLAQMKTDIYYGMWEGITKSDVIIVCLSKAYLNSANCERELKFAADLKKPLLCVYMFEEDEDVAKLKLDPKYGPLLMIVAGKLYSDFKKSTPESPLWQQTLPKLIDQVEYSLHLGSSEKYQKYDTPLADWLKPADFTKQMQHFQDEYVSGTRKWIASPLNLWFTSGERLVWLNGAAGTGKSVIAWLVADRTEIQFANYETGSVFFCRSNDQLKRHPHQVISTMAWDLSNRYPSIKAVVENVMVKDQQDTQHGLTSILRRPIEAFKALIVDGLHTLSEDTQNPILLVIDALDEPEEDIWEALNSTDPFHLYPTSVENRRDLEIFAVHGFSKILEQNIRDIEGNVVSQNCVTQFVTKSEGVFVWARCVMDYLGGCKQLKAVNGCSFDVQSLLQEIISFEAGPDNMYKRLMHRASSEATDLTEFRRNLSIILAVREPVTITTLSVLGGWSTTETGIVVAKLRSILNLENNTVTVIHKSLKDFLTDVSRSGSQLYISLPECDMHVAKRCFEILDSKLKRNLANLDPSEKYLKRDLHKTIPADLIYAARFWASHFEYARYPANLIPALLQFCQHKFAMWMEVMLLLNQRIEIVKIVTTLDTVLANLVSEHESDVRFIRTLLDDSRNIAINFLIPLEYNPLQIYNTVGVWAKKNCEFFKTYNEPSGYKFLIGHEKDWGPLSFLRHSGPARSVTFSNDGRQVVSGSDDKTIKVWSLDGTCVMTLDGHADSVRAVVFNSDDKMIISGSLDETIKVWRSSDGSLLQSLSHGEGVIDIATSGSYLASAGQSGMVKIWDISTWKIIQELNVNSEITQVSLLEHRLVALSTRSEGVQVYNVSSKDMTLKIDNASTFNSISFSRDGSFLVGGNTIGEVVIWSLTGDELKKVQTGTDEIHSVAVAANMKHVITTGDNGKVCVIDVTTLDTKTFQYQTYTNYSVAISCNASFESQAIAIAGISGVVDLLLWKTPVPTNCVADGVLGNLVSDVAFEGDLMYTLEENGDVKTWDLSSGIMLPGTLTASQDVFRECDFEEQLKLLDSWIVDENDRKVMWIPIYAQGVFKQKGDVMVLMNGNRFYVLKK